jgi:hypothetical protein
MTATANLTALHAAAVSGDRFAMLLLADALEEARDDARADAWRWLADPPAQGWERRACAIFGGLRAWGTRYTAPGGWSAACYPDARLDVRAPGTPGYAWRYYGSERWGQDLWRAESAGAPLYGAPPLPGGAPPPEVREAVLSACLLALAG